MKHKTKFIKKEDKDDVKDTQTKNNKKSKKIKIIIIALLLLISLVAGGIFYYFYCFRYTPDKTDLQNDLISEDTQVDVLSEDEDVTYNWQLNIPKLNNIVIPISEGTDSNTLRTYAGHIEGTGVVNGNIAIAAHTNTANYYGTFYFNDLNKLETGDEVYYKCYGYHKKFVVSEILEVDETNLDVLNDTDDTTLTLITCITGKHEKRLVVKCSLSQSVTDLNEDTPDEIWEYENKVVENKVIEQE